MKDAADKDKMKRWRRVDKNEKSQTGGSRKLPFTLLVFQWPSEPVSKTRRCEVIFFESEKEISSCSINRIPSPKRDIFHSSIGYWFTAWLIFKNHQLSRDRFTFLPWGFSWLALVVGHLVYRGWDSFHKVLSESEWYYCITFSSPRQFNLSRLNSPIYHPFRYKHSDYFYTTKSKSKRKLEGDPRAPVSIATTPRCRAGRYSFPKIVPLYP